MAAPGTDERLHRDAIVALVGPVLADRLFDYGGVPGASGPKGTTNPGDLPDEYTTLNIERDPALIGRTSGLATRSAWAVTFESVSGNYINGVRNSQSKIAATIEGAVLTIDGHTSTPVAFEQATRPSLDADSDRFVGRYVATYVL